MVFGDLRLHTRLPADQPQRSPVNPQFPRLRINLLVGAKFAEWPQKQVYYHEEGSLDWKFVRFGAQINRRRLTQQLYDYPKNPCFL